MEGPSLEKGRGCVGCRVVTNGCHLKRGGKGTGTSRPASPARVHFGPKAPVSGSRLCFLALGVVLGCIWLGLPGGQESKRVRGLWVWQECGAFFSILPSHCLPGRRGCGVEGAGPSPRSTTSRWPKLVWMNFSRNCLVVLANNVRETFMGKRSEGKPLFSIKLLLIKFSDIAGAWFGSQTAC